MRETGFPLAPPAGLAISYGLYQHLPAPHLWVKEGEGVRGSGKLKGRGPLSFPLPRLIYQPSGRTATETTASLNASQAASQAAWVPVSQPPEKLVSEGGGKYLIS